MALVIETGAVIDGANSFIDGAYLSAYLSERGLTTPSNAEPVLIRAFEFMASLDWCMPHSRPFEVTENMKKAQAEIAYQLSQGLDEGAAPEQPIKREKVDVLEVEYFGEASSTSTNAGFLAMVPRAKRFLDGLLCNSGYLDRA